MPSLARTRLFRDVLLVCLGALSMHFLTAMYHPADGSNSFVVNPHLALGNIHDTPLQDNLKNDIPEVYRHVHNEPVDVAPPPPPPPATIPQKEVPRDTIDLTNTIPETIMVEHVPGWTVFKNLYMSGGTLFVVSSKPRSDFPELFYITSTGLTAENTPENIEARLPTSKDMAFITVEEANSRWGSETSKNRIWSLTGSTVSGTKYICDIVTMFNLNAVVLQ